jgi:hypothetical protein
MNKSKVLSIVITVLLFTLPGTLIYFLAGNPNASIIFLTFLTALIITYRIFSKELGLKIDDEIRREHSWWKH